MSPALCVPDPCEDSSGKPFCGEGVGRECSFHPRRDPSPPHPRVCPEESWDLQPRPGGQGAGVGASEADPGAGGRDVEEARERKAGGDHIGQPGWRGGWSVISGVPEHSPLCRRGWGSAQKPGLLSHGEFRRTALTHPFLTVAGPGDTPPFPSRLVGRGKKSQGGLGRNPTNTGGREQSRRVPQEEKGS